MKAMRFERETQPGVTHFMEVEFGKGSDYRVGRRGYFINPKKAGFHPTPVQLATESPLIHDGGQCVLTTASDARNSTLTGTTLAGPNGSGQFLAVFLSTGRTVSFCSTTFQNLSTVNNFYGILQNKPRGGEAADIGIFGVSKMVAGSTTITAGTALQTSSTSAGVVTPWAGGNGRPIGMAISVPGTVGEVFTGVLFGGMAPTAST